MGREQLVREIGANRLVIGMRRHCSINVQQLLLFVFFLSASVRAHCQCSRPTHRPCRRLVPRKSPWYDLLHLESNRRVQCRRLRYEHRGHSIGTGTTLT